MNIDDHAGGPRRFKGALRIGAVVATAALLLTGCTSPDVDETPATDATLSVAIAGSPPTLDPHRTSAALTQQIAWHIYEGLWTVNSNYEPRPMLAESGEYLNDGGTFRIKLREGLTFHDGSAFDSSDVVASLDRWREISTSGPIFNEIVDTIKADGPLTVDLTLKFASPVIERLLAVPNHHAAIMPSEVIEAAGEESIETPVGTGPFAFTTYVPDQQVELARFEDYIPLDEPSDGMAGARNAKVAELNFVIIPEVSVRRDSVITGQVDVAENLAVDMFSAISTSDDVEAMIVKPYWWPMAVFDKTEAPFDNVKARQAFMAALDMNSIMQGAFGSEDFYRLQPGILNPEQTAGYSDAGKDVFNNQDLVQAKKLLKESGYNGEPLIWLTTRDYDYMYTIATIAQQQLAEVGFNVELEVVDYATIVQLRTKPESHAIFSGATTFTVDGGLWPVWDEGWPGSWVDSTKDALIEKVNKETDEAKRLALWTDAQEYFYQELPVIKFGDFYALSAVSNKVDGVDGGAFQYYWNVTLK